ncbi:MAG: TIGR01212 family radical SAM protein [Desulfobulbaceae bacterium]|nr:TIGR01212 family radical SAM protein [Desulfobulbaceae bacterium]
MITTFSTHYRQKYGGSVGKIPLDVGVKCPNRRTGGCIFCQPAGFTPLFLDPNDSISSQLGKGKKDLLRRKFRFFLGYFQQETVTALSLDLLKPILEKVIADPLCVGLIISTRPDYIYSDIVAALNDLQRSSGKEILVELGLQSIHQKSLDLLNRNHSYADYQGAATLIRQTDGLQLGAHLIFGIPGESTQEMLSTVEEVCASGVDALKFHHLQVIRDTELHHMYQRGEVGVFTVEDYMKLLSQVIARVPQSVVIHRFWSTSHPDILIAPKWNMHAYELNDLFCSYQKNINRSPG